VTEFAGATDRARDALSPGLIGTFSKSDRSSVRGHLDEPNLLSLARCASATIGTRPDLTRGRRRAVRRADTGGGRGVRAASGPLAAARLVRAPETAQMLTLLAQLAVLAEAVARMRAEQDRAVQAAARQAAEQIRDEHTRRLAGVGIAARQAKPANDVDRYRGPVPLQQRPGRSR